MVFTWWNVGGILLEIFSGNFYPLDRLGQRGIIVARICVSARPSVCLWTPLCPHDNSSQISVGITKLHQTCILGYSWLVLSLQVIDFGLKGHFGHEMVSWLTGNKKEVQWLDTKSNMWPWIFTSAMSLNIEFFKVKFWNNCISGILESISHDLIRTYANKSTAIPSTGRMCIFHGMHSAWILKFGSCFTGQSAEISMQIFHLKNKVLPASSNSFGYIS